MKSIKKYLIRAKKDNKVVDFKHIKLLLIGSSAVGKSSFCHLLFGSKFSIEYNSTDVMDNKQAFSMIKSRRRDEEQALTIKKFGMLKQEKEIVWCELDLKQQINYFKSLLLSDKFYNHHKSETSHKNHDSYYHDVYCKDSSVKNSDADDYDHDANNVVDDDDDDNVVDDDVDDDDDDDNIDDNEDNHYNSDNHDNDYDDNESFDDDKDNNSFDDNNSDDGDDAPQTDIEKKIVEAESLPDSFTIETVKLVTVVDTGGQPEYIHLLPAINNYPTITFLIHDLTKRLDDPVQIRYKKKGCEEAPVQILNYSYLDMIHLLMCFVSDSLEQPRKPTVPNISVPKKSYIGFVGTHYDKVKDDPTVLQHINDKLSHIINKKNIESRGVLSPEIGNIYPVDNTTAGDSEKEDPTVKNIRSHIEHYADQIESKTLPITWMILQLKIQELCASHHKRYITYAEYVQIAKESIHLDDDDEIKASLMYFHFIGILLYFPDPSLCNYIIINLQWLYNSLAEVMHLSVKNVYFRDSNLRKKFNDQRLLAKHNDCEINLKDINQQELEYLFNLLIHFKVIANITIDNVEFYYMPCVLSNLKMCDDKHKHLLSEPLLVQSTSGFLPRGFFCSLVVYLLKNQPQGWEHQLHKSAKNYSDLMIFRLPDKTYLYMHDKIFYLKVEVRHGKKHFSTPYHSKIFNQLHQSLTVVCEELHFDCQKLQYGFLCLNDESDSDHIAVIHLPRTSKFMPTELECSRKCSSSTKLDESHNIWFKEVRK